MTVGSATGPHAATELLQAICRRDAAPAPFTLVIQAHPDDEVIGLGAHLTRLNRGSILHVTDGAPHDGHDATANGFAGAHEYSRARRAELEAAGEAAIRRHLQRMVRRVAVVDVVGHLLGVGAGRQFRGV